jgi:hypothetical protein
MKDEKEFFSRMKDRDPEIILKMVKCVLSASKRKRPFINIFDITFKDSTSMSFSITKDEYKNCLKNCLQDMINIEEYELCSEISKIINKKPRKKKIKES